MTHFIKYSQKKAPAGILREPFYKIFPKKGPCGHIKGTLLQNIKKKGPCGHIKGALLQNIKKKAPSGIFPKHEINNLPHFIFRLGHLSNVPTNEIIYLQIQI